MEIVTAQRILCTCIFLHLLSLTGERWSFLQVAIFSKSLTGERWLMFFLELGVFNTCVLASRCSGKYEIRIPQRLFVLLINKLYVEVPSALLRRLPMMFWCPPVVC